MAETGQVLTIIHKIHADSAWLNFSQASLLWTSAFAQTWASADIQTFLSNLSAHSESLLTIRENQFLINCPIMLSAHPSPPGPITHLHTHTHTHTHRVPADPTHPSMLKKLFFLFWFQTCQDLCSKHFPNCNQFRSMAQAILTLWDPIVCSTSGFTVHHQLPELA